MIVRKIASALVSLLLVATLLPAMAMAAVTANTSSTVEGVAGSVYSDVYTGVYAPASFEDLTSHWAKADIELLASHGIISGVSATEFQPDRSITRAEFAALVVRALDIPSVTSSAYFTDVTNSAWYASTVSSAVYTGIVNGYEDNTFRPSAQMTREELAAIVVRALDYVQVAASVPASAQASLLSPYSDADQIVWAHQEMAAALNAKLLNGISADKLGPANPATRAEAAVILTRFLKLADRL
ncbi:MULTISPECIES: S-layer homology domain-containing protein [Paenibacillus]|uniref:S-layer homology domain-containing protein n=1 Tax=Paenibacillus TaxID=44249 RepID=UPI0022B8C539|nr:S-layer homology domain-containing protein [Paenibacillus caseinilyticus]MCZ8523105.1 S-layer homology domain-containing protein [Paenibacillus caseinilyticus]